MAPKNAVNATVALLPRLIGNWLHRLEDELAVE